MDILMNFKNRPEDNSQLTISNSLFDKIFIRIMNLPNIKLPCTLLIQHKGMKVKKGNHKRHE